MCRPCESVHRISIHAAREGGDLSEPLGAGYGDISIHAAREGGDRSHNQRVVADIIFQSTPPVKAATRRIYSA